MLCTPAEMPDRRAEGALGHHANFESILISAERFVGAAAAAKLYVLFGVTDMYKENICGMRRMQSAPAEMPGGRAESALCHHAS